MGVGAVLFLNVCFSIFVHPPNCGPFNYLFFSYFNLFFFFPFSIEPARGTILKDLNSQMSDLRFRMLNANATINLILEMICKLAY